MEIIFLTLVLILANQPQEEAYWICEEPLKEEEGYLVCDLVKINS
jgi:hypothetical protein